VVIDDHDIDAAFAQPRDLLHRRGPAVDRDEYGGPMLLHAALHTVLAEPVTLLHAQRQKRFHHSAQPPQDASQQCRGGDAVHIVVTENHHAFTGRDGPRDALRGLAQIGEQERIAQRLQARIEKRAHLLRVAMASLPQKRRDLAMEIVRAGQLERLSRGSVVQPSLAQGAEVVVHGRHHDNWK
jgi:hypothetical protein